MKLSSDRIVDWKYALSAVLDYPERLATGVPREEVLTVYLTERIGGTTQYIGDDESGLVGTLPADVIEVLEPLLVDFPQDPGSPPAPQPPVPDPGES